MLTFAYIVLVSAVILIINERAIKQQLISAELSRKIPHITLGLAFALVPFYIGLNKLIWLAVIDIFIALIVHKFDWFKHSRAVDRTSWGEYFFLFGSIFAALLTDSLWVFATAMLILGIADALAALVGKKYGNHQYKVFDNVKSLEGSLVFVVATMLIIRVVINWSASGLHINTLMVVVLSLATTAVEAIAPFGLDNFLVPIFVVVMLRLLL